MGEEKQRALEDMGLVYSQALLMICAADDRSSNDGLRGVNVARNLRQYTREIMPGLTLSAQYAFDPYLDSSIYNTRGWTIRNTKRRLIGRKATSLSMLYFRAVETYTARSLTYSSDIINALAGVLQTQVCGYILLLSTFQNLHPNQFYPPPRVYDAEWYKGGNGTEPIFEFLLLSKANYHCEWEGRMRLILIERVGKWKII
ncbi:hypothetical protein DID88_010463 [Monilinia fructigena]|uniref:Heterokaryon incompatibility domain-containing protein n=1 Tax=Monilinia fructigena TaxID=38457 RepID=A0A395IMM0_9HELO|nr:hypothetical protein DID88_010463 [Monilinia fructigena]